MAYIKVDEIEDYLGKPVNDPYGRRVGYIIGFYSDSDGNVTSLEISIGDFEFKEIDIDRFEFNNGDIILIPEWEYEAKRIENRLERLRKRVVALNELFAKKEVPRHAYEKFKKKLETDLIKTKEDAKNVRDLLRKRLNELDDTLLELEKTLTSLKVSYLAGEIPDKAYKVAADQIRKHMDFTQNEKENVKKHLEAIDKLEKQPIDIEVKSETTIEPIPNENQTLPVVVLET
jgi:DNA repair exonuclease SbcCD ATPase subunit